MYWTRSTPSSVTRSELKLFGMSSLMPASKLEQVGREPFFLGVL